MENKVVELSQEKKVLITFQEMREKLKELEELNASLIGSDYPYPMQAYVISFQQVHKAIGYAIKNTMLRTTYLINSINNNKEQL